MGENILDADGVLSSIGKLFVLWLAWVGSLTLVQWSMIGGIVSTFTLTLFTILQICITVRDKILRDRPPWKQHERQGDTASGDLT